MLSSSLATSVPVFVAAGIVSMSSSLLLVARIERAGTNLQVSDALIGLVAAFCADAPEISSSVTALSHHEGNVGIGVVFGSNVFNLAALLGLSAVISGRVAVHRRAALLEGAVGTAVAIVAALAAFELMPFGVALGLSGALLAGYVALVGVRPHTLRRLRVPSRAAVWLALAVRDEALDSSAALPRRERGQGAGTDAAVAALALAVVVIASILIETSGTSIGARLHWPTIVTGGVLLAAVTSLPNAVAALYLASRGRGAAVMAEATNSNAFNILAGFLIPAVLINLSVDSFASLSALWYVFMTGAVAAMVVAGRGLGRGRGVAVVAAYLGFVVLLVTH